MYWRFPSQAQIHFSYFDNYSDVDKIQGKEYAYIGADELGQWENDKTCYRDWETDRKSTRLNSSHLKLSRMPSSA